jgi:hypothetical protein
MLFVFFPDPPPPQYMTTRRGIEEALQLKHETLQLLATHDQSFPDNIDEVHVVLPNGVEVWWRPCRVCEGRTRDTLACSDDGVCGGGRESCAHFDLA